MPGGSGGNGGGTADATLKSIISHRQRTLEMIAMQARPLDPLVFEFATEEEAASYESWFCAKVAANLADPRPSIPHDEAMARVEITIKAAERAKTGA